LENVSTMPNNWVKVTLQGKTGSSNKAAIGAKVEVLTPLATYTRYVEAGNGHMGPQEPLSLTFGLGSATTISGIRVTWPNTSHTVTTHTASVNSVAVIAEP